VAHFQGITASVAHVRNHPTYLTQHGFLASWGFVQQVKMLGYSLKHTSSLRGSFILPRSSFALRWPTSWSATVFKNQKKKKSENIVAIETASVHCHEAGEPQ
jgi:hypothetical protein